MRIAVFSDVHGNFEALNTVMDLIGKEQVDQTIFIGDIFQRGDKEIEFAGIKLCLLIFVS